MATAPRINFPDGSGTTTELVLTSNVFEFIFTGVVDSNIIDIQIDINGSGFVSDPSLMNLALPNFTVPNLLVFPNGISLERGQNTIKLRAIDLSGAYSSVSTISINVVSNAELGIIFAPPTGISLQRNATSVTVNWSLTQLEESQINVISESLAISGYNVYASTEAGGSGSGYLRVNAELISASSPTENIQSIVDPVSFSQVLENPDPRDPLTFGTLDESVGADVVVTAKTVHATTNEDISDVLSGRVVLGVAPKYKITTTVERIYEDKLFSYTHNRGDGIGNKILNSDTFSIISDDEPLYYVVTTVYFDKGKGTLQESRFSAEMSGGPLTLDTTVRGIRIREQDKVAQDYIKEINEVEPTLSLIPGSTVREIHIEPFSNEVQKVYFLMDFVHRSKSFAALLQIDDPNLTGTSVLVANSSYKQNLRSALDLSSDAAVQSLINSAFESLAQNFNVARSGRRAAVVTQTFYIENAPTTDLVVAQDAIVSSSKNSTAPRFRANGSTVLTVENAQSFYNPVKRRYEVKIQMVAEEPGSIGNVAATDLDTVTFGASGLRTINESAASFGRDRQSNLELAENATRALSSLDTGTEGGYKQKAIAVPGVLEARIVKSGDKDMMRDYDEIRSKHIGGKVDVYTKGTIERTITESFAFQFDSARNVRFDVLDATSLVFQARDSRLTENNPISEMLFNPSQGFGLRNHSNSPTTEYDLTGYTILDYRTIRLNTSIPQSTTLIDDFIEGDYRFRSNNKFITNFQPVRRIISVVGEISGTLDSAEGFTLFKTEDPLLLGESTLATDNIEINQLNGIPSGNSISKNNELHVMIGQFNEPLNSVGVNIFSIVVYDADRQIIHKGPGDPNPDYLIVGGSQTESVSLRRSANTNIENGSTISVDYEKDENFQVTYVINDVLQRLQTVYEESRHTAADVLVKQALENPLSSEATVQLSANADKAVVDSDIRTNYTVLTDNKGVGGSVRQSDLVAVMDNIAGVDFVVQPFAKFTLANGALRIRDNVPSNYVYLPSLSQFTNAVYLLTESLPFDTIDGGGDQTQHRGVFKDELIMEMANSLENIGFTVNQSWIIGRLGAIIPGYSDGLTISAAINSTDNSDITAERLKRTANKTVISLDAGQSPMDTPNLHTFTVSYIVNGDRGIKDVETSLIEYLTPGDLTITYRGV